MVAWLEECWRYRELFWFLIWRDLKVRYRQTVLGVAWAIIQPVATMVVFSVFFGRLAGLPSQGVPYAVFSYSTLVAWTFFAGAITYAGNSLVANGNLLSKVYFPRVAIPGAAVLSGLPDFAIASVVVLGLMAYYAVPITWSLLLWPVMAIPLVILAFGISVLLSAVNVKYRDVKYAIPFVVQLWLFLSPIIYPSSMVPERFRIFLALNPLSGILEGFRAGVVPEARVEWTVLGPSLLTTAVVLVVGIAYFRRAERAFADTV
jgi:lipopolysaccharide transport system permease protein